MRNNDLIKPYNLFKLYFIPKITPNRLFYPLNCKKLHLILPKTLNIPKIVFYYLIISNDGVDTAVLYPCNRVGDYLNKQKRFIISFHLKIDRNHTLNNNTY